MAIGRSGQAHFEGVRVNSKETEEHGIISKYLSTYYIGIGYRQWRWSAERCICTAYCLSDMMVVLIDYTFIALREHALVLSSAQEQAISSLTESGEGMFHSGLNCRQTSRYTHSSWPQALQSLQHASSAGCQACSAHPRHIGW